MTDPKNPLGGSKSDDFDELLDALGEDLVTGEAPGLPPKPAAKSSSPMYQPAPSAPGTRASDPGASSLFDDEDAAEMPTRTVDIEQLKREAGETPGTAARSGLEEVFSPKARPTSPPPSPEAAAARIQQMLGDESDFEPLSLDDEEHPTNRPPNESSIPAPSVPRAPPVPQATEDDDAGPTPAAGVSRPNTAGPVPPPRGAGMPPPRAAGAPPPPPRPGGLPLPRPGVPPPARPAPAAAGAVKLSLPMPSPRQAPELSDLVDGLDDPTVQPRAVSEPRESGETTVAAATPADVAAEKPAEEDAEAVEAAESESAEAVAEEGADAEIEAGEDEGPEFETETSEEEETISLEVSDEEEAPAEQDRGALLAATVTSRRKWQDEKEVTYEGDPKGEAEARVAMLESEASQQDDAQRGAEMFALAGELVEGVFGDRVRAKSLYERAFDRSPNAQYIVRALRRIALLDGDVARARELCEHERGLPLSNDEREELEMFSAEVAALEGPAHAEALWEQIGSTAGVRGSIAKLLLGGSRHNPDSMAEALGALGQATTGPLAAAASLARARLAERASEDDTALAAVQAAVQRDPSDVTSWLAMARIALGRENAAVFREALLGIARTSAASAAGWGAIALERATGAVLGDTLEPTTVPTSGVAAWLVTHALRDAGLDERPQIDAALEHANDVQRASWSGLAEGAGEGAESDVGRYLAARRAVQTGQPKDAARAAAALVGGDEAQISAFESAMLAGRASPTVDEVRPLDLGTAVRIPELAATLLSATAGVDAAEAKVPPLGEGVYDRLAEIERGIRGGTSDDAVRQTLDAIAASDAATGARVFALREGARLASDLPATVAALRNEYTQSKDPKRTAALQFLAAAISSGLSSDGAADEALDAARALEGELSAAELAALFGMRGEIPPAYTSEVLTAAAGEADSIASRTSAVRAALRLAAAEPEAAGAALFKVWQKSKHDGPLAALTLRALPHDDVARRGEILRDMAERAQTSSTPAALASWTLLAHTLAEADKPAEAAQALARARTFALNDPALLAWEENLWLSAGMFAEVAERSFDALKAAATDEAKIAAYERLAELDSAFRNDVASAVLTYQAILELAPGHMASLRTLERYFLEQGRFDELLGIYDRLIRHVGDPQDAVAVAHAAARIAIRQADGDHGAGTPFWVAALERGSVDLRLLLELDSESRRAGDARRFADVSLRAENLATDPAEKATFAARGGEILLALGDTQAAVDALGRAVTASPKHVVALAWLAEARKAAGDMAGAAEAYELLGKAIPVPAQRLRAFYAAAVIWQDEVKDASRTGAALSEVLAIEPSHPDAFARSVRALKDGGDRGSELAVLDARVAAGGDPAEILPIHLRIAELAEELGDSMRARMNLKAALSIEPDRQEALRSLARLARGAGEWAQAADAMIKLARLTQDASERVELMFSLGEIFDRHLNDPKRAEAAYKRVLQFSPGDEKTLSRMAELYGRSDDPNAEAETLRSLIQATQPGANRRGFQIRLATVLSEKLNDPKKAEEALEAARREAPTDMDVLRAFARLYVRQEAPMALAVLLDRAAGEVRRQLDADLTSAPNFELLTDILKLRGRVDGARVVGAVAEGLGVQSEKLQALAREGGVPGAGSNALTLEVLEMLAPPTVTTAHRELMRLSADVIEKMVPFDAQSLRAEKLGPRPHGMRAEIEKWARTFMLESVEIYLGPSTPLIVMPVGRHPPAIMIPADLRDSPTARFAIVRALAIVSMSLGVVTRLAGRDVTFVLAALLRLFEPMFVAEGMDSARVDDFARRITRPLSARHAEMAPHAFEVIGGKATDGDAMAAGVVELANRVALLASGDVKGAIEALTPPGGSPRTAVTSNPALGRLVRVAISDRFLEARHMTGADKRASVAG